jgi:hypothetical protein
MASSNRIDTAALQLGELVTSQKGAKTCGLTVRGTAIYWTPGSMEAPFEPRAFDGQEASRVSLCLRPTDSVQRQLEDLDSAILSLATADSTTLFGKELNPQAIIDRYQSALKVSEKGALMRAKIDLFGGRPCRYWSRTNVRVDAPETWAGSQCTTRLCIKALWFVPKEFGVLLEVHDALVTPPDTECPFMDA